MSKYVIRSEVLGVYLGSFAGLGLWSNLDRAGQTQAPLFDSFDGAFDFKAQWEEDVVCAEIVEVPLFTRDSISLGGCLQLGLLAKGETDD